MSCPYINRNGCGRTFPLVPPGLTSCPGCGEPIYSTDALRLHERFRDDATNGEVFGQVSSVLERVLALHFLRLLERQGLMARVSQLALLVDGPLAVFGPPAWLSATIGEELARLNDKAKQESGSDLILFGLEKSGPFVDHFEAADLADEPGKRNFPPRSAMLPTDAYIKRRIVPSDSARPYGQDTYFGRKVFYKTASGGRLVLNLPIFDDAQADPGTDDLSLFPQWPVVCALVDRLVSSRYPNALYPISSAHAEAAIPLHLGGRVLKELAKRLMRP